MKNYHIWAVLLICNLPLRAQDAMSNSGNLQLYSGAYVAIYGDLSNTGSFTDNGSMVYFNGTSAQSISSGAGIIFNHLTIDNSNISGITASNGNIYINGSIVFSNGVLHTTSTNMLVLNDGAGSLGASNSSYIEGPAQKIGNEAFSFPVGKSGNYQPLYITAPAQATDTYTAEYFMADPRSALGTNYATGIDHVSGNEYWYLNRNSGTSDVNVKLGWNLLSGLVNNLTDMRVANWDGASWQNLGNAGNTGNSTSGTVISASAVSFYGPLTLASASTLNPIPVTVVYFHADLKSEQVYLNWETASELNNAYFTIERSANGSDFEILTTVEGHGTSYVPITYSSIDKYPYAGISYYRLKQTDYNGKSQYSNTVSIKRSESKFEQVSIYPNPTAGNDLHIFFKGVGNSTIKLVIKDISGRPCYTNLIQVGDGNHDIEIERSYYAQPGIYMLQLSDGNIITYQKIIVQ